MIRSPSIRQGTILILVAGLAGLLLSVVTAILISQRSGSAEAEFAQREAQARIMLSAAVSYIQESSRIGWGGESFGWNDVRATSGSTFAKKPVGEHGAPGPLTAAQEDLTALYTGYPLPGTSTRGEAFCWERPPGAISERFTPNPIEFRPDLRDGDDIGKLPAKAASPLVNPAAAMDAHYRNYAILMAGNFTDRPVDSWRGGDQPIYPSPPPNSRNGKAGGLEQQPLADKWDDADPSKSFLKGIQVPRAETLGRAWFRIYRETTDDHDGNGDPWYDTVPLKGHGVFIVTVGAGATRGYRFWEDGRDYLNGDRTRSTTDRGHDPDNARTSGLFTDLESFIALRSTERIFWYRLEWTAAVPGYDADYEHTPSSATVPETSIPTYLHRTTIGRNPGYFPNFGGTIRWLMRLEKEPPRW